LEFQKLAEAAQQEKQKRDAQRLKNETEATTKTHDESKAPDPEVDKSNAGDERKNLHSQMRSTLNNKPQKIDWGQLKKSEQAKNIVIVVLTNAKSAADITRFQRLLERIEGVRIMLTGGSIIDGILFGVTLTIPVDLIELIKEIPIVDTVTLNEKTILVSLTEPDDTLDLADSDNQSGL
jgi:hypothetical protein